MVASAPSDGADTSTRLAPAVRWAVALALALKMPVHSIAISTPSSFQGSFDGSRSAETLILPLPTLIESPSTVTVPGKRPCTESKRKRWALVSTGPRSLMPTTSISLRPDSAIARSTLRPMRPNPLIATRTAIQFSSNVLKFRILRLLDRFLTDSWAGFRAVHAPNEQSLQCIIAPNVPIALLHIQALCGGLDHRPRRDPKMLVERFRRGAGAEALPTA